MVRQHFDATPRPWLLCRSGMTLPETMITLSIFGMVLLGLLQVHMFGARQDQIVGSKVGASDQSRMNFQRLTREIRGAKNFQIGTGSSTNFLAIPDGEAQQGTALQIFPSTDSNTWIRYFYNPGPNELRRMVSGSSQPTTVASSITNTLFFRAEDHLGNVRTDREHNYVVRVLMEFYQYSYPLTRVGDGYYYDYYKLEFKATRRAHD